MRVLPKLGLAMLPVALSVTLALSSLASARQVETMTEQYRSKGEAIALALAFSLSANTKETLAGNVGRIKDLISSSKTIAGVSYIYIQDWEESILAHTFEPTFPTSFSETNSVEKGTLRAGERVKVAPSLQIDTPQGRIWAMDIAAPIGDGELGGVHVGMDLRSIEGQVASVRRSLVALGLVVGIAGVLLGLLMAVVLFVRPIRRLTALTNEIATRGDLTIPIDARSQDEIGDLARSFARMVDGLRGINGGLQESARVLTTSGSDLTHSAQEQQHTITRQAAALQQTQSTAQEIRQTSAAAARKAESVLEVAKRAEEITRSGEAALEKTIDALSEMRAQVSSMAEKVGALSEASGQIGRITDTVKDLADQSNMLALNAAIEAVRSGEHGKGFAVVAREIRSLADQSIQATSRVREILEDIGGAIRGAVAITERGSQKIEGGLLQVKQSGENLRELSNIVKDNSSAVRQIAAAVSQQNAGITQIFSAVTDQTRMMDETMRRLETTTQAASTLKALSDRVSEVVGRFRV